MPKITIEAYEWIEKAIYLPMVIIILNNDKQVITSSHLKFTNPYSTLLDLVLYSVQNELATLKKKMKQENIRVEKTHTTEQFTHFIFFYKGLQEEHTYLNARLRNKTEQIIQSYLLDKYHH